MTVQNINTLYYRPTDVTLTLKDPHYPDHDLGIILLSVVLTPKEGEHRDVVSPLPGTGPSKAFKIALKCSFKHCLNVVSFL